MTSVSNAHECAPGVKTGLPGAQGSLGPAHWSLARAVQWGQPCQRWGGGVGSTWGLALLAQSTGKERLRSQHFQLVTQASPHK